MQHFGDPYGLWQSSGCGDRVFAEAPNFLFELDRDVVMRSQAPDPRTCAALAQVIGSAASSHPADAHTWTQPWLADPNAANPAGWLALQVSAALAAIGEAGDPRVAPDQVHLRWVQPGMGTTAICARLSNPDGSPRAYSCSVMNTSGSLNPLPLCEAPPYPWGP